MTRSSLTTAVTQGLCALALAGSAPAFGALVFDRGLPTSNLNNAAEADRSNVAWADVESSSSPSEYWLPGDDFTLSGTDTYAVSTIRVWSVGDYSGLKLLGGTGGAISVVSSSFTATKVSYSGGATYQGSGGSFTDIYQLDFSVSFSLAGGTQYEFFLDGPWQALGSDFRSNFLHASNKDKSGSVQQGSDDVFKWYHVGGAGGPAVETWLSGTGGGSTGWSAGWDKNSDGNVQVFATVVPEPEAYGLALAGLGVVGFSMRLRRRRAGA